MFKTILRAAMCVLVGAPCALLAQQSIRDTCAPALDKDIRSHLSTDQQYYAYISQISESTFEQLKRDASAGVNIPIPGLSDLLNASAQYNEFQEKRRQFFQSIGYVADSAREQRDLEITTSAIAYVAWSECVKTEAARAKVLYVYKDQEDEQTLHVVVVNNTPVLIKLTSDLWNGTVTGAPRGAAFSPGTKLRGGGTIGILIHRTVNDQPLRLALNSIPPFDAPVIESQYGALTGMVKGDLKTTYQASHQEDRGIRYSAPYHTPNLHNQDCNNDPCTGDRKWQLAYGQTLTIDTSGKRFLRNPSVYCYQDNLGSCGWANESQNARCVVDSSGQHASCNYVTGSRDHYVAMHAQEYEIVENPSPEKDDPYIVFRGGELNLRVPHDALTALFSYSIDNQNGNFKPGAQASIDGRFALINQSRESDADYYSYRVMAMDADHVVRLGPAPAQQRALRLAVEPVTARSYFPSPVNEASEDRREH